MRRCLEEKLQGKAVHFTETHLQALCRKGLNSDRLAHESCKSLHAEADPLPEALVITLLQPVNPESLLEQDKARLRVTAVQAA